MRWTPERVRAILRPSGMPKTLSRPWVLVATAALSLLANESTADACAVCQSGAPVAPGQAPSGEGQSPSRVPLTIGLDARAGAAEVQRLRVDERRLEVLASYDFPARISVDVGLPVLFRTVSAPGTGTGTETATDAVSLGDLETRVRYLSWRRHTTSLSLFAGVKWPTAPVATGPDGTPLSSALQPGCSSIAPLLGASTIWGLDGWTLSAVGQVLLPFSVREAPHPGASIRLAGAAERRLTRWLATRASLALRLEMGGALATDVVDPNSGGAALYVTTEALLRPFAPLSGDVGASLGANLGVSVGLSFPVVQGFFGDHRESPVASASVSFRL